MSKIIDTIEDGKRVFKKPKESDEEIIFYNTDYFKRIGFPDAEVSIGKMSPDGVMKGGYYENIDELTFPFRHFVFLIQGTGYKKPEKDVEEEVTEYVEKMEYVEEPVETNKPGFFERIGRYNKQVSTYFKDGIDRISPYFEKKDIVENNSSANKPQEQEKETSIESVSDSLTKDATDVDADTDANKDAEDNTQTYWIVKIPIIEDTNIIPKGKYENEEEKLNAMMREDKENERLLKTKVGEMLNVCVRYVSMCEGVKDYEGRKYEKSEIKGSLMDKMSMLYRS
jgi:hypothetical protein